MVREYAEYCEIKKAYVTSGKVDMSSVGFVYPTTLLPLCGLIADNPKSYVEPVADASRRYISAVLGPSGQVLPGVSLANIPRESNGINDPVQVIYDMGKKMQHGSVQSAFAYAVNELVANIYEHSRFKRAMVLGQRYDAKGFMDISFFDDGMTIPGTLRLRGGGGPSDMIRRALNGTVVKEGRSYGLRTTFNLITDCLRSSLFIASGEEAAYCIAGGGILPYRLYEEETMQGTLITVRMPLDVPPVNIYQYLE